MTAPVLYTTAEAAAILRVSESYLKKAAGARIVPCRRMGRLVRFSDDDLAQIVAAAAERPVVSRLRRSA